MKNVIGGKLNLGIPTGRLETELLLLLRCMGVSPIGSPNTNRIFSSPIEHPLFKKVSFIKPSDMCGAIKDGYIDTGFVSSEVYDEWHLRTKEFLYFSKEEQRFWDTNNARSTIALIGTRGNPMLNLSGARKIVDRIVTDYPQYAQLQFPKAEIISVAGGVEGYIPSRATYGITLVETGATLKANKLVQLKPLRYNWVHLYFGSDFVVDEKGSCEEPLNSFIKNMISLKVGAAELNQTLDKKY